ncbi:unnamed protein product [Dibothriocephalus latus]|uniref:Uncharacterized protein n=1 Tax=Dibothriocephalus latus TaxID=60516 RepID=A0A3P7Q6U4_DIBLA|nr:unnamed protein product [Dibothriocephalus latus]
MWNGYPKAFINRCLRIRPRRTQIEVSEVTERIAAEQGVGISHISKTSMRNRVVKIKDRPNSNEQCLSCPCNYTGQTERMLGSRIHENKLAVSRADTLTQVVAHNYRTGHEFNFVAATIIAHAGSKISRELLEACAWDENSVNRYIDLVPACIALRRHIHTGDESPAPYSG